jgi:hypothetical protein
MALTGSSWLAFWEFVEISGAVIVTVGVVGEYIADFTKLLKGKARKTRLRKISTLTLIAGLAIELVGLTTTSHAFNLEVAKANDDAKRAGTNAAASYERAAVAEKEAGQANERAAKLEFAAAELKAKINETDTNVAKIDPLNQPIASLTASVSLAENGTNRTHIDPSKPLGGAAFVKLKFRCSKHPFNSWPYELICSSCETFPLTTNISGGLNQSYKMVEWSLEFGSTGIGHFGSVMPPNATVRDADELDVIEFDAPFLPPGTEIMGGDITLTINSTKKKFEIPPQNILKVEEIPLTKEQKDQGVILSFRSYVTTKPVTLVSW